MAMVEGGGSSKGRGGGRRKRQRESGADERALKVCVCTAYMGSFLNVAVR